MSKRHAIIESGKVVNVVVASEGWRPERGEAVPCPDDVSPGALWDGRTFRDPRHQPRRMPDLPEIIARRIKRIEAVFAEEGNRLAVSPAARERMRGNVLGHVAALRRAATREEADRQAETVIAYMRDHAQHGEPMADGPTGAPAIIAREPTLGADLSDLYAAVNMIAGRLAEFGETLARLSEDQRQHQLAMIAARTGMTHEDGSPVYPEAMRMMEVEAARLGIPVEQAIREALDWQRAYERRLIGG